MRLLGCFCCLAALGLLLAGCSTLPEDPEDWNPQPDSSYMDYDAYSDQ